MLKLSKIVTLRLKNTGTGVTIDNTSLDEAKFAEQETFIINVTGTARIPADLEDKTMSSKTQRFFHNTVIYTLLIFSLFPFVALGGCILQSGQTRETPSTLAPHRILIVHSYHEGWGWTQDVSKGIMEGMKRKGYGEGKDYELKTFYMDTKITYTTPDQIKQRAALALDLIDQFNPDLVFVHDDDATKYVAVEYTSSHPERKLPFVFSGVNADPSIYEPIKNLERPVGVITGALERFPYNDALLLAKRLVPGASRIVLMADSSDGISTYVAKSFKAEFLDKVLAPPLQVEGPILIPTFREWQNKVKELQTKADFLGIVTYQQLKNDNGNIVPALEVVKWTVENSKLPEIGFLSFHAEDGFLSAVGVSGYKTGIYVGIIGGEILGGRAPSSIPIINPGAVETTFNIKRADILGIRLPAKELAQADAVFYSIGSSRY